MNCFYLPSPHIDVKFCKILFTKLSFIWKIPHTDLKGVSTKPFDVNGAQYASHSQVLSILLKIQWEMVEHA